VLKVFQFVFGAVFIVLGAAMLFLVFRDGGHDGGTGQAWLAPLALIGAGALSISHARRKPKKW
jgi:hypothetical protein